MSEYEQIFHKQELYEMFVKGEVKPLDDLYGIEDLALSTQEIKKEIEWLKGYKSKKIEDISRKTQILQNKLEFFKKLILSTLQEYNEKSVDFPGSCKVTSRNQKAKWNIVDEEEFIGIIEKAEEDGEKVDGVVEEVKEYKVRKKPAEVLLDTWEKNGNFEKYFGSDGNGDICVSKDSPKKTVSFTYPKSVDETGSVDETVSVTDVPVPSKESDFDAI